MHKIKNEKYIPIPPEVETGNSWKACGVFSSLSIKNLKLLDGKYLLIQKGKKKYYFIIMK